MLASLSHPAPALRSLASIDERRHKALPGAVYQVSTSVTLSRALCGKRGRPTGQLPLHIMPVPSVSKYVVQNVVEATCFVSRSCSALYLQLDSGGRAVQSEMRHGSA